MHCVNTEHVLRSPDPWRSACSSLARTPPSPDPAPDQHSSCQSSLGNLSISAGVWTRACKQVDHSQVQVSCKVDPG